MKKNKKIIGLVVASLFLLTAGWKPQPQMSLSPPLAISLNTKDVQVTARVYSSDESKENLHRDLVSRGYIPIEITVHNNTGKSYAISGASVPLACTSPKKIAWSVTKGSLPRSIGLRIASFFFWPAAIPSTIDGISTYKSHRALVKDLTAKTLKEDDEVIPPYAALKRVVYVEKESVREEFSFSLQEVGGKDLKVIPLKLSGL